MAPKTKVYGRFYKQNSRWHGPIFNDVTTDIKEAMIMAREDKQVVKKQIAIREKVEGGNWTNTVKV